MTQEPTSFVDKIRKSQADTIRLLKAESLGKPCWYYIQIDKIKMPQYLKQVESGEGCDLKQFGRVLYKGWGDEPPENVKDKIKAEYS